MTVTPDQYARKIANELTIAHNSKDQGAVDSIFVKADDALVTGRYNSNDQKEFWSSVRTYFRTSGNLLLERQAGSALAALMQAIEAALAARTSK